LGLPKRFYKDVATVTDGEGGWRVTLDGKTMRTPAKGDFIVPAKPLADAIAEEWRAQGEHIQPESMPLTKLVNSAVDGARGREDLVLEDILGHAASDLLFYRADAPDGLVSRQTQYWDPVLAWARQDLCAPFVLGEGVMAIDQPPASLERLRAHVTDLDAFGLTALHVMTTLSGSALLALAVALGRLTPEQAWKAAHVDEDWQIGQWGEDAEAQARRERRWRDFAAAARMLKLLKD